MRSSPPALRGPVPLHLPRQQQQYAGSPLLREPPRAELKPQRPSVDVNQWSFNRRSVTFDRGSANPGGFHRGAFGQGSKFEPSQTTAFGTWRHSPGPLRPSPPVQPTIPSITSIPSTAALLVALSGTGGGTGNTAGNNAGVAERAVDHGAAAVINEELMLPAKSTLQMSTSHHTGPLTPFRFNHVGC